MSKNRTKIGLAIDSEIDKKLDKFNYNKSKLINSLLNKWLKSEKDNIKTFQKNND
jgi:hypothetical protein